MQKVHHPTVYQRKNSKGANFFEIKQKIISKEQALTPNTPNRNHQKVQNFVRIKKKSPNKARNRGRFSIDIRQETTRSNNKTLESLDGNAKTMRKRKSEKTHYSDKQIQDHEKDPNFQTCKIKASLKN